MYTFYLIEHKMPPSVEHYSVSIFLSRLEITRKKGAYSFRFWFWFLHPGNFHANNFENSLTQYFIFKIKIH